MKTIIALRGKKQTGKTSTIRKLYELLLKNKYAQIRCDLNRKGGEITAVLKKNGVFIGLASKGDSYITVHDNLQELIENNCTICVCTCKSFDRFQKGTHAAVFEFEEYNHQFIEKDIDNIVLNFEDTNTKQAKEIFSIIESLL